MCQMSRSPQLMCSHPCRKPGTRELFGLLCRRAVKEQGPVLGEAEPHSQQTQPAPGGRAGRGLREVPCPGSTAAVRGQETWFQPLSQGIEGSWNRPAPAGPLQLPQVWSEPWGTRWKLWCSDGGTEREGAEQLSDLLGLS